MTLVRATEVAAVAGSTGVPDLTEALRLLREQASHRWVAGALTMAALVHERQGRPAVAAHLLGGVVAVAESLAEDPHPLPVVATLVDADRRLAETLGADAVRQCKAAGRATPVPQLLQTALKDLEG